MKSATLLASALLILLNLHQILTADQNKPERKYNLVSIQIPRVKEHGSPWGPWHKHVEANKLSPRTIADNCKVLPCDKKTPCPHQCGACSSGFCSAHPTTILSHPECSGDECPAGMSREGSSITYVHH